MGAKATRGSQELGFPLGCSGEVLGYIQYRHYAGAFKGVREMKEIIDRACDIECVTESDAKAVAALADLAVQLQSRLESLEKDAAEMAETLREMQAYLRKQDQSNPLLLLVNATLIGKG